MTISASVLVILLSALFICTFSSFALLHPKEVKAWKEIARKLGKKDWDFAIDPCEVNGNWSTFQKNKGISNTSISCICPSSISTCHINKIELKGQNLTGEIPFEFSEFKNLESLDISRNCFTGLVPSQWASMHLVELILMGNNLSGPFPLVLTNISTLEVLHIEANRFSGPIPPEIGKLTNLKKLILSSNRFTGKIPQELFRLVHLQDLRISDTRFSGQIPDMFDQLKSIRSLRIQGTLLKGPIPATISSSNLTDLFISDLKGNKNSRFPDLSNMKKSLRNLIMRSCLLTGNIPEYLGNMEELKVLDLSFNSLNGEIPSSFSNLMNVKYMYLTRNELTGVIPRWVTQNHDKKIDISNNKFTWIDSSPVDCDPGNVNMAEIYSSVPEDKLNQVDSCLMQNFPCASDSNYYSLRINCGGRKVSNVGEKKEDIYEADLEPNGASTYYKGTNWALTSTGHFLDIGNNYNSYIKDNSSALKINNASSDLYTTARVSPLSLTYYGLCLINGLYTVNLHFAEIVLTDSVVTFGSLGYRLFDIYIQGNLVVQDFNIVQEAGGAATPIIKTFDANVTTHTLEIHLYWAGRGTQGIPYRGIYGPLISAISVSPNFKPPSTNNKRRTITISASVAAAIIVILACAAIYYAWKCFSKDKGVGFPPLEPNQNPGAKVFTLEEMVRATRNFHEERKLGEGGFGSVYRGELEDGRIVAVKKLSPGSWQGISEFLAEVQAMYSLQHPNLVKLYGCCMHGEKLMLVYEFVANDNLSRALFDAGNSGLRLDWTQRYNIILGVAKGLAYMHEEAPVHVIHRDLKPSNILLDENLDAKISDFGLAKLTRDDQTHLTTRPAGTKGYIAPEHAMHEHLSKASDVYTFGVVLAEVIVGKKNSSYTPKDNYSSLIDHMNKASERGDLLQLVDPNLQSNYKEDEALFLFDLAIRCTQQFPRLRPTMPHVVKSLEERDILQLYPSPSTDESLLLAAVEEFEALDG